MNESPYRVAATVPKAGEPDRDEPCPNGDMLPVLTLLWIGSIARVALAMARGEALGAEATLASAVVVALPILVRDALRWSVMRARSWLCS